MVVVTDEQTGVVTGLIPTSVPDTEVYASWDTLLPSRIRNADVNANGVVVPYPGLTAEVSFVVPEGEYDVVVVPVGSNSSAKADITTFKFEDATEAMFSEVVFMLKPTAGFSIPAGFTNKLFQPYWLDMKPINVAASGNVWKRVTVIQPDRRDTTLNTEGPYFDSFWRRFSFFSPKWNSNTFTSLAGGNAPPNELFSGYYDVSIMSDIRGLINPVIGVTNAQNRLICQAVVRATAEALTHAFVPGVYSSANHSLGACSIYYTNPSLASVQYWSSGTLQHKAADFFENVPWLNPPSSAQMQADLCNVTESGPSSNRIRSWSSLRNVPGVAPNYAVGAARTVRLGGAFDGANVHIGIQSLSAGGRFIIKIKKVGT